MTDLRALLAPIRERLAAATKLGEWEVRGKDVVIYDPNGYGAHRIVAWVDHAEYTEPIANAPTDLTRLLAAIEAVTGLHREGTRDFITALPCIREECDCENECPTEELPVCRHCWNQLEQIDPYFGEQHHVSEVMWPCPTATAVAAALGSDTTNQEGTQ